MKTKKMIGYLIILLLSLSTFSFSEQSDSGQPPPAYADSEDWLSRLGDTVNEGKGMLIDYFEPIASNFNMNTIDAFFQSYIGLFTSSQAWNCAETSSLRDIIVPSAFVGMFIMIAIAIIYMLGELLQSQNLIAFSKEEMFNSLRTIILIVAMLAMVFGANEWFTARANPNDPIYSSQNPITIIDAAMQYSKLITYDITSDLAALLVFNTFLHTLYSATVYVGVTLKAMFSFSVGPILKPLVDILGIVIQFLSAALGEWMLHYTILCFIKRWTWSIFIPLGLLLSAIPHTRNAGNALIAIFFSFSLIYPIMLVANWEIFKITSFTIMPAKSVVTIFFKETGIFGIGLFGLLLLMTLGSVIMPILMGFMITAVFSLVKNAIYYIVIVSLLLPFLNIFITLTAARETARAFGSEINFAAFVKLI